MANTNLTNQRQLFVEEYVNMSSGGFDFILISNQVKNDILKDLEADFFYKEKYYGQDIM
jgi:hypothetical protein